MTDLNLIARKLEEATGADRRLDSDIFVACGGHLNPHPPSFEYGRWPSETEAGHCFYKLPAFTGSTDAALTIADQMFPGAWDTVMDDAMLVMVEVEPFPLPADFARYICLALIRALIAKEGR